MTPDAILGWSQDADGRRSHVIGATDIVVGSTRLGVVRVVSSLCGQRGHSTHVSDHPNQIPCARCLNRAWYLTVLGVLPDMTVPDGGRYA